MLAYFRTLIVALALISVCLPKGTALRCYDCFSLSNLFCNDPFHKNSTASKEYPPGSVCVKVKGDLKNGEGFILRREGLSEAAFDEMVHSKMYANAIVEKCKTDLCNAAASPTPALAFTLAAAAAAAAAAALRVP